MTHYDPKNYNMTHYDPLWPKKIYNMIHYGPLWPKKIILWSTMTQKIYTMIHSMTHYDPKNF